MKKPKDETFFDLIHQAQDMLSDRPRIEQDLIYFIAKMDNELRAAIILAYETMYEAENRKCEID